jgi:hypothetical protein
VSDGPVERNGQPSEDRQINVQLDTLNPTDAERDQCPSMLEVAELALNGPTLSTYSGC